MTTPAKKSFDVEFFFSMRCVTRGWSIQATTAEEAERLAESCVDDDGNLIDTRCAEVGLEMGSWATMSGEASDYELADVKEEVEA